MVSKRDFDNVTYEWSSLKRDLCTRTSIFHSFPVFCRHLRRFTSISRQNQTLRGEENLLDIQVSVCYILKHLEDRNT